MNNLMKKSKKGFTLMEMLIVVAIIAILVVIAIPTFTNALNEAKVNTDLANIRAWYAEECLNAMLENDGVFSADTEYAGPTLKILTADDIDYTFGDNNSSLKVTVSSTHLDADVVIGG